MKRLIPALAVLTLSAASLSVSAVTRTDLLGEPAQAPSVERAIYTAAANRTIEITDKTKWVNVTHGEVVRFVSNGSEFTWAFDGVARSFDLTQVAPAGFLGHSVTAYVAPRLEEVVIG